VQRRPGGVTFAGWLMGINGVFSALAGLIVLLVASNTREMTRHGLSQGPLVVAGFVALTLGLLELLLYALFGGSNPARIITTVPDCSDPANRLVVLVAQSVPTATLVPCIRSMPVGWSYEGSDLHNNVSRSWLSSTVAGSRAVELELTARCDPGDAPEVVPAPDEAGARVFDAPTSLDPFQGMRFVVFTGGCVRYDYRFASGVPASLSLQADDAFSFVSRAELVAAVRDAFNNTLCGADAPPCEDPG
jgi:hypothetical protein